MADIPRAYKLNKEKRAAEEDGKFLYYSYDRKKLTSVALPEEQFDMPTPLYTTSLCREESRL